MPKNHSAHRSARGCAETPEPKLVHGQGRASQVGRHVPRADGDYPLRDLFGTFMNGPTIPHGPDGKERVPVLDRRTDRWTNPSVKRLAGQKDPVDVVISRARDVVLQAVQDGWEGPPFDPFRLAEILGIVVVPMEDILDARVAAGGDHPRIEFNPNRPRTRVRFSLAHEIAHTFFPDYGLAIRNRGGAARSDDWELELLCNVAASELLMPTGYAVDPRSSPSIDTLLKIQEACDVSVEAAGIRLARSSRLPCMVVVASRQGDQPGSGAFRVDYSIASVASEIAIPAGAGLEGSVFSQCTAVGFTAKGREEGRGVVPALYWECVGIPPYPGQVYPRVLGICRPATTQASSIATIEELRGDALRPRGGGPKLIVHVVNDSTASWGGNFSKAVKDTYPGAQTDFREWAAERRSNLSLGAVRFYSTDRDIEIASMVAQRGYGPSNKPRIRYGALRACLGKVAERALRTGASVHMPRIGAGMAGGNWSVIAELIDEHLVKRGIQVTVYSLPGTALRRQASQHGHQTAIEEDLSVG